MRSNVIRSPATPEQRCHRSARSHQAQRRHAEAGRCFASGRKAAVPRGASDTPEGRQVLEETESIARALEQRLGRADPQSFKTELDRLGSKDTAADRRHQRRRSSRRPDTGGELSRTYELTRSLKKGLGLSI
uniref:Uncharacterized protein n=1 Tax=Sinorhizobium meliloti (strain SM11) TaxID=707241 RepID=Q1WLD2_SINMM|nr:hypothetical protein [Sinorhizobium meliloti]